MHLVVVLISRVLYIDACSRSEIGQIKDKVNFGFLESRICYRIHIELSYSIIANRTKLHTQILITVFTKGNFQMVCIWDTIFSYIICLGKGHSTGKLITFGGLKQWALGSKKLIHKQVGATSLI